MRGTPINLHGTLVCCDKHFAEHCSRMQENIFCPASTATNKRLRIINYEKQIRERTNKRTNKDL